MPIHDWTHVEAEIFHAFHHSWIEELSRALNGGILPEGYYALPEQLAGGFGPDVLALQSREEDANLSKHLGAGATSAIGPLLLTKPAMIPTCETNLEFYRRKQDTVVIRHITGDRVVAMIEIVSPGNKGTQRAIDTFIEKAAQLLDQGVHLLVIDLFPPGRRDPGGLHSAIWERVSGENFKPQTKPACTFSYEADLSLRAYFTELDRDQVLPEVPLFLAGNACVNLPLDISYHAAFAAQPRRWREVLK